MLDFVRNSVHHYNYGYMCVLLLFSHMKAMLLYHSAVGGCLEHVWLFPIKYPCLKSDQCQFHDRFLLVSAICYTWSRIGCTRLFVQKFVLVNSNGNIIAVSYIFFVRWDASLVDIPHKGSVMWKAFPYPCVNGLPWSQMSLFTRGRMNDTGATLITMQKKSRNPVKCYSVSMSHLFDLLYIQTSVVRVGSLIHAIQ